MKEKKVEKNKIFKLTKAEEDFINNAKTPQDAKKRIEYVYAFDKQNKMMEIMIDADLVVSPDGKNKEKFIEAIKKLPVWELNRMSLSAHQGMHVVDRFFSDMILFNIASVEKINLEHDWRKCLEITLELYDVELKSRG